MIKIIGCQLIDGNSLRSLEQKRRVPVAEFCVGRVVRGLHACKFVSSVIQALIALMNLEQGGFEAVNAASRGRRRCFVEALEGQDLKRLCGRFENICCETFSIVGPGRAREARSESPG